MVEAIASALKKVADDVVTGMRYVDDIATRDLVCSMRWWSKDDLAGDSVLGRPRIVVDGWCRRRYWNGESEGKVGTLNL